MRSLAVLLTPRGGLWVVAVLLVLLLAGIGVAELAPLIFASHLSVSMDAWHPGDDRASGTVSNPSDTACRMASVWLDYGYTNPGTSIVVGPDARPSLGPHATARWSGRLYPAIPSDSPQFKLKANCVTPSQRDYGLGMTNAEFDAVAINGNEVYLSQNSLVFLPGASDNFVIAGNNTQLDRPEGVTFSGGRFYVADTGHNKVWVSDIPGSNNNWQSDLSLVAGNGTEGFSGDGGPPGKASLNHPTAVAVDPVDGSVYIADTGNNRVRVVDGQGKTIRTLAATITPPRALAVLAGHRLAIGDGPVVRIVALQSGTIDSLSTGFGAATGLASCGDGAVLNIVDSVRNRLTVVTFGSGAPAEVPNVMTVKDAGGLAVSADCTYLVAINLSTHRAVEIFLTGWY